MGIIKWVGGKAIPNDELQAISIAWDKWSKAVIEKCRTMYLQGDVNDWYAFWEKVLQTYWTKNFRDVALAPFTPEHAAEGNFGGLGLTVSKALSFIPSVRAMAAGEPFSISALYTLCGHCCLGLPQPTNCWVILTRTVCRNSLPNSQASAGNSFKNPLFAGVAAIPEMHLFAPINSYNPDVDGKSMYDCIHMENSPIKLYTSCPVTDLDYDPENFAEPYVLTYQDASTSKQYRTTTHHLVFSQTGWSVQMNTRWSHAFTKNVFIESGENSQPKINKIGHH